MIAPASNDVTRQRASPSNRVVINAGTCQVQLSKTLAAVTGNLTETTPINIASAANSMIAHAARTLSSETTPDA